MDKKKTQNNSAEIAVLVDGVDKVFKIPHEKHSTLKQAALNIFNKKVYQKFEALDNVSFKVKKGEFFGIVGRNGCGKSTLLKIIAGIYEPTKGNIKIKGRISPFLELGVGFNPELTARENVFLNGALLGLSRAEIARMFGEIIRFAELEEFVDMKLKNFSSGMQVRLAFSVAIRAHAEILLIDEVLAVGDANFQEKCIKKFKKFKSEKKTILFVTHSMELVEKFCDRALLLNKGKVICLADPKKVAHSYNMINVEGKEKEINNENSGLENEEKGDKRMGDGGARTEKTWVETKHGKKKNVFSQEKERNIVIKTKIKFYENIQSPIFGITIKNQMGQEMFVTNTLWKKIKTGNYKKNQEVIVSYEIENLLIKGDYSISPAIANKNGKHFYDWNESSHVFSIVSQNETGGMIVLDHDIEIRNKL